MKALDQAEKYSRQARYLFEVSRKIWATSPKLAKQAIRRSWQFTRASIRCREIARRGLTS